MYSLVQICNMGSRNALQCTFVTNEMIQYYLNGGESVHVMLLKAFDRVQYIKLFQILQYEGLCLLIISMNYLLDCETMVFGVIGGKFCGGLGYVNDVTLLAQTHLIETLTFRVYILCKGIWLIFDKT